MSSRFTVATLAVLAAATLTAQADLARADRPRASNAAVRDVTPTKAFDPSGWTRLARVSLSSGSDRAQITLSGAIAGTDQLALVVDGDLDVNRVSVATVNGKRLAPKLAHRFSATSASHQIALKGNTRALSSLTLRYAALPDDGGATVTVYGRASAAPPAVAATKTDEAPARAVTLASDTTPSARTFSSREGWTLLGAQTVDGKDDTDVVRVPKDVIGMFSQIAVVVTGGDLELEALKLRFAGGTTADLGQHYYFRGSVRSQVVTVPGGDSNVVRVVQLRYGKERGAGKTRVELWAR